VDDDGNELGSGVMELTDTELILYTRKRDSVKWHYLCLRRYGYDSNLFSFESGRRCQTGQGRESLSFLQMIVFGSIALPVTLNTTWHGDTGLATEPSVEVDISYGFIYQACTRHCALDRNKVLTVYVSSGAVQ
jgi:hypothetical protein